MLKSAPPAVLAMPLLALTTLVDAMLPNDPNAELRLARAPQLDVEMFREFRRREIGPAEIPPEPLATLGYALVPDVPGAIATLRHHRSCLNSICQPRHPSLYI